jgi:hypothetical protein
MGCLWFWVILIDKLSCGELESGGDPGGSCGDLRSGGKEARLGGGGPAKSKIDVYVTPEREQPP